MPIPMPVPVAITLPLAIPVPRFKRAPLERTLLELRPPSAPTAQRQQRSGVAAHPYPPAEDRPDRPEVAAAGRRPDPDQHQVHEHEGREMDADARLERAAAAAWLRPWLRARWRRRRRRQVGRQRRKLRCGARAVRRVDALREI